MDPQNNQPNTDPQPTTEPTTPAQIQQDGNSGDLKDGQSEVDKWKHWARTHEANWKKASQELEELRKANMTDAERAVAEAEERGRRAALESISTERAQLKLEAAAARAGVDLTPVQPLLDVSKFLANGEVNEAAINEFVAGYAGSQPKAPKYAQNLGIGPQSASAAPGQLTRADLQRMSPRERAQAMKDGKFDALMRGQI